MVLNGLFELFIEVPLAQKNFKNLFRLLLWLCKVLLKTVLLAAIYQFLEF
jgi:hypothetical protein